MFEFLVNKFYYMLYIFYSMHLADGFIQSDLQCYNFA